MSDGQRAPVKAPKATTQEVSAILKRLGQLERSKQRYALFQELYNLKK